MASNPKDLINSIKNLQSHYYPEKNEEISPLKNTTLDKFAANDKSVKVIFDNSNFKLLSVSENVGAVCGYTQAEFHKANTDLFLQLLTLEHCSFPYTWIKWGMDIYNTFGTHTNMKTTLCGAQIKHKDGHVIRTLIRFSPIDYFENGTLKTSTFTFDNISHLMKADFYWGRTEFYTDKQHIQHLFSNDKKYILNDIISDREKDVLCLIADGKESKEIADTLFISPHTVDNHRRNMLTRTGVRDTTALIHICRMSGII